MQVQGKRVAILATAAAAFVGAIAVGSSGLQAAMPFDWSVTNTSGNPAFTPAPFLTDSSAAAVKAYLVSVHNSDPSAVLAVKVNGALSDANAKMVFDAVPVKYVFADFESANSVSQTSHLVTQLHASGSKSSGAFVGEFGIGAYPSDPTSNGPHSSAASFAYAYHSSDYANSHENMSNPSLYPGAPDFQSNTQQSAPNIRSALFVLPVDRLTFATVYASHQTYPSAADVGQGATTAVTPGTATVIPWVARFNNYGNSLLNNTHVAGYSYAFNTTSTAPAVDQNQLLSRNDFAAQVLQYRLRGATNFNLFNYQTNVYSSVIGYSVAQEQSDAIRGWTAGGAYNGSSFVGGNTILNNILSRPGSQYSFANLVNKVPGPTASSAGISAVKSGMVLSGVYDKTTNSSGQRTLALLLSNVSATTNKVYIKETFGGYNVDLVPGRNQKLETIAPGTHELLTFVLGSDAGKTEWKLTNGGSGAGGIYGDGLFNSGGSSLNSRSGVGVPEPTTIGLLGLAGAGLLARRRRQA